VKGTLIATFVALALVLGVATVFGAGAVTKPAAPPAAPAEPPADPNCPLSTAGSTIGMTLSNCATVASDTASDPNPLPFWGKVDCAESSRHQQLTTGGDPSPTADGSVQGNSAFRRLTVLDGDNISGERCELGYNWAYPSDPGTGVRGPGPTVFYREGMRRATFISLRLPPDWKMDDPRWQVVMQMKQAQPYNNPTAAPIIDLEVRAGRWIVFDNSHALWSAPATADSWTRFALDVVYSQDPAKGSIQVHADLNGDGDSADRGETSPLIRVATLVAETSGSDTRVRAGSSIPSHLRAGIYHDATLPCPPSAPCSVDVDNVQVVAP
jgi:hypothetical protein